jgi:hypothetical protein
MPTKSERAKEEPGAARREQDTRPLKLKSTDNKTKAGVINYKLKEPIASWAHASTAWLYLRQMV